MPRFPALARCIGWAAGAMLFAETAAAETLEIQSHTRGKPTTIRAEILMPAGGDKPLPVMIVMHGSGGVGQREKNHARDFNQLGIAAVIVDSFGPRGVKQTVEDQDAVDSGDMTEDVAMTAQLLARDPRFDAGRIGLIGFSKGGTAALRVSLVRYVARWGRAPLKFAIALYPWCGFFPLNMRSAGHPLFMFMGGEDRYVDTQTCVEFAGKFEAQGGKVSTKIYPDAPHGWDGPGSANWSVPKGQNASKCRYVERSPGTWVEMKTGIVVEADGKPTPDGRKAAAGCLTPGVAGGYRPKIAAEASADIRAILKDAFKLP